MPCEHTPSTEEMVAKAQHDLLKIHAVIAGDVMGVVAGTQRSSGSTNFLRLHIVGATESESFSGPRVVTRAMGKERRNTRRFRPVADRRKK